MNKVEISDGRDLEAVIPAVLDDYGLDPYEFRIYGRLTRRCGSGGAAWESVSSMAIACGMGEQKAKQCLRLLCIVGLVERRSRPGHSSEYLLLPVSGWSDPSDLKGARREASYHPNVEIAPDKPRYRRPTIPEWAEIRQSVFIRDAYTCQYCGASDQKLHCDHILPMSRGGTNELSNLATACKACNLSKGSKTTKEWKRGAS